MDFVETKFFYKNHVLELILKIENMSKKQPKTEKLPFFTIAGPKLTYVGKVPKIIFENLREKLINFEANFVGKVPKNSVFNGDCLENDKI